MPLDQFEARAPPRPLELDLAARGDAQGVPDPFRDGDLTLARDRYRHETTQLVIPSKNSINVSTQGGRQGPLLTGNDHRIGTDQCAPFRVGWTDSRIPIALSSALMLFNSGFPFGDSVRYSVVALSCALSATFDTPPKAS